MNPYEPMISLTNQDVMRMIFDLIPPISPLVPLVPAGVGGALGQITEVGEGGRHFQVGLPMSALPPWYGIPAYPLMYDRP